MLTYKPSMIGQASLILCLTAFSAILFNIIFDNTSIQRNWVDSHLDSTKSARLAKRTIFRHLDIPPGKTREHFSESPACKLRKPKSQILCKLNRQSYCYTSGPAEIIEDFWVVAPIYSYDQMKTITLYSLHVNFKNYIKSIGLSFCTIEGVRADLDQEYAVTKPNNEPYDIQIQIYEEAYLRENLLNVAIKKIPKWEYVAWIDAHQVFQNKYWWEETIIKCEKYANVQLFIVSKRLNERNTTLELKKGAIELSLVQTNLNPTLRLEYGNAYAIRKDLYNKIGYILDTCIASACDLSYIAASVPEYYKFPLFSGTPRYIENFKPWLDRARLFFNNSRTFVRGEIIHFVHPGYFKYEVAAAAYNDVDFNVTRDLVRDENGVLRIINPAIRQIIPSLAFKYSKL